MITRVNREITDRIAPDASDPMDTFLEVLEPIEFDRALHLGAGRDKWGIATKLRRREDVIAMDADIEGLASNDLQDRVAGDGHRLPIKDDSVDLVFSEYVFEHLPEPELALAEIRRVLSPGGSFVVLVPNPKHYYAKIADLTPSWFHLFWLRLQGRKDQDRDLFPTQYEWGTYSDVVGLEWGELEALHSIPGPTNYTLIVPFHFVFVLFDRAVEDRPTYHLNYIAHYRLPS